MKKAIYFLSLITFLSFLACSADVENTADENTSTSTRVESNADLITEPGVMSSITKTRDGDDPNKKATQRNPFKEIPKEFPAVYKELKIPEVAGTEIQQALVNEQETLTQYRLVLTTKKEVKSLIAVYQKGLENAGWTIKNQRNNPDRDQFNLSAIKGNDMLNLLLFRPPGKPTTNINLILLDK